jgi:hypothetical protein
MDVVARTYSLPVEFKARGTVSVIQASLTVDTVSMHLRQHPELIDAWLAYSEDKRTSSGWYVTQCSADSFEVGYYPKGERIFIAGAATACAEFIVREVRSIAG